MSDDEMSSFQIRLATIVSDAEAFSHLDPKYAEVMHAQLSALVKELEDDGDSLHLAATMLNAELTVAKAEVGELTKQRNAVREYLQLELNPPPPMVPARSIAEQMRIEVERIVKAEPVRKIEAIKQVRTNVIIVRAWSALGGDLTGEAGTMQFLTLKDAKGIVDAAYKGYLMTPRGEIEL